MADLEVHGSLRGELAFEDRVSRFDGCEPPQPPRGRPGLMMVLLFFFVAVPITATVVVSDPPLRVWKFIPGLLVGVVLGVAYHRWWRSKGQRGQERSLHD